jgi:methylthioribulose-1-phosphate dehydratase
MFSDKDLSEANKLVETIHFFNQKGWSPATSTNYSCRSNEDRNNYLISRSGVDKSRFQLNDLIVINQQAEILRPFNQPGIKSSAETEIHTALYKRFPDANCVLHTHSVLGTVLSQFFASEKQITFHDLEIIKGIEGFQSHDEKIVLPIVRNSQDMKEILFELHHQFDRLGSFNGFLIAGHGLYTWGKNLDTAKRHIETYEFLLECLYVMRRI